MFHITRRELNWGGRPLVLESGRIARQADGAVLASYGETTVLCTAVAARTVKPGQDFFPLTVNYQEKAFAAGKIPGGFFKREGRPAEKETLTSRLIDRPIRPLFPEGFRNETQVICTVLAHDQENDPDIISMIGASAALTLSGVPFLGPIAGARVGYRNGEFLLNPTCRELLESELDLVVAGTRDAVMMVESEAKELPEETMLGAVLFGQQQFQPVIDLIIALAQECAKEPWELEVVEDGDLQAALAAQFEARAARGVRRIRQAEPPRTGRGGAGRCRRRARRRRGRARAGRAGRLQEAREGDRTQRDFGHRSAHRWPRYQQRAADRGRGRASCRGSMAAACSPGARPRRWSWRRSAPDRTSRSSMRSRATTASTSCCTTTSRPTRWARPACLRSPGRREIGHGKLAWRAIRPLLPPRESFPYTIRLVSEITESNGSSSMATVCGSSLALMDAGVPLGRPVAGIAMGLIKEGERIAVLSDILGDEDHLGDMDFKVAGTEVGVTSLQMDIKIAGITEAIMRQALTQARDGRLHILDEMAKGISGARPELRELVPRISVIQIPQDKIGAVIGPGGKMIREICEKTGAKIDIEDDGKVKIASSDALAAQQAADWIRGLTSEPEVGVIYTGTVVRVVDFGAFIKFLGAQDGLCHISELRNERVGKVTDVVKEGDTVKVKVLSVDDRGKVKLTHAGHRSGDR